MNHKTQSYMRFLFFLLSCDITIATAHVHGETNETTNASEHFLLEEVVWYANTPFAKHTKYYKETKKPAELVQIIENGLANIEEIVHAESCRRSQSNKYNKILTEIAVAHAALSELDENNSAELAALSKKIHKVLKLDRVFDQESVLGKLWNSAKENPWAMVRVVGTVLGAVVLGWMAGKQSDAQLINQINNKAQEINSTVDVIAAQQEKNKVSQVGFIISDRGSKHLVISEEAFTEAINFADSYTPNLEKVEHINKKLANSTFLGDLCSKRSLYSVATGAIGFVVSSNDILDIINSYRQNSLQSKVPAALHGFLQGSLGTGKKTKTILRAVPEKRPATKQEPTEEVSRENVENIHGVKTELSSNGSDQTDSNLSEVTSEELNPTSEEIAQEA